jgi:hypothetical protein
MLHIIADGQALKEKARFLDGLSILPKFNAS